MNALLTIQIRVAAQQARKEIGSIGTAMRDAQREANKMGGAQSFVNKMGMGGTVVASFAGKMDKMGTSMARTFAKFPAWNKKIESMGKNMQWTGRQLEYNFTLPLAAAGYMATKWALDNERAFIQVKKVYGDLSFTQERINSETNALATSFDLLSTRFGVNKAEVIDVAAAWASAGSAGRGLAENTRATMEAMIIGDMDAATATEALISIMSTYRISSEKAADGTSELGGVLADLNIIENQTGIRFSGLIDVMTRAGGSAAQAGVDIRHLSAMAAALVPSAGSAAQAGNSLRTMISRLQAPTRDTIDVLEKMGINVMSEDWLGKTATEKIEHMADSFLELSSANQTLVSSVVASRWQVNRFSRLMEDIGSKTGYYQKALDATADTSKEVGDITQQQAAYWRELGTVLDSNPKKFDILTNSIKNSLTSAIIPLLPAIQSVLATFALLAQQFSDLDPQTQKYIVFALAFIAITGPIIKITSAWIVLLAQVGKLLFEVGKIAGWMGKQFITAAGWILSSLGAILGKIGTLIFGEIQWTGFATTQAAQRTAVGVASANAIAAAQGVVPPAAMAAATATAGAWSAAGASMAGSMALGAGAAATSQALVPAAAASSAVATAGIWARMWAGVKTLFMGTLGALGKMVWTILGPLWRATFQRLGIIIMTALEGAVATVAGILGLPFWAAAALIAAAVAAIIVILDDDLRQNAIDIFKSIGRGIMALPRVFAQALSAVARVVASWIEVIWDALSYLNPFQRHSPSLVDMVKAGVRTILDEYSALRRIGPMLMGAARAHEAFNEAIAATQMGFDASERGQQRADVAKVAPSALPEFDTMGGHIDSLKSVLPLLTAEIARQTTVTAQWQATVDLLERSLERETAILDNLKDQLDAVESKMNDARSALTDLGNVDLPGMRAMEDQLFANEMAQKALRLEMLRMEEAGQSVDDLMDKMSRLSGFIETLRGEREDLRLAGAGSDILGTYDAEIAALEAQREAIEGQGSAVSDMQKQLEELQRQSEILDLERALAFDDPLRQIDQMIEGLNEMPFDQIVADINKQKEVLTALQPQYDAINAKLKMQEAVVGRIQFEHDQANARLTEEQRILDDLEAAYSAIEDQINSMSSALSTFAANSKQALADAEAAQSTAEELFDAGVNADFETPIGGDVLGAVGGLEDIEAFNAELQAELERMMGDMGGIDIFGGIKQRWEDFKDWLGGLGPRIGESLRGAWDTAWSGFTGFVSDTMGAFRTAWDTAWSAIGTAVSWVWESVLLPVFSAIGGFLSMVLTPVFNVLGAVVSTVFGAIGTAAKWMWDEILYPVLSAIGGFLNSYVLPIFQLFGAIVEIVFTLIGRAARWVWDEILWPIFTNMDSIITGVIIPAWNLLQTVVTGVIGAIWMAIQWAWNTVIFPIFNAMWGFIQNTLGPVFTWLWQSVIQPAMSGIGTAISWVWQNVIQPIFSGIDTAIRTVVGPAFTWLRDSVISPVWNGISTIISGVWDTILRGLETGINAFIRGFNFLARGVKRVASALSIDVTINEMDTVRLASGGVLGGQGRGGQMGQMMATGGVIPEAPTGGFYGKQARAIVAEGSRMHREFVIPTDPKYRNRARGLFALLADDLGMPVPQMASGGIIPDGIKNAVSGIGDLGGKIAGAAGGAFNSTVGLAKDFWNFITNAKNALGGISSKLISGGANWAKDKVSDWGRQKLSDAAQGVADFLLSAVKSPVSGGGGGGGASGAGVGGNKAANRAIGYEHATLRGWIGPQWNALDSLIMGESGWNNTAQNPTSSAYGIFQFLNSTWSGYGVAKTSDPTQQIIAGYRYIAQRYGNPMNAYSTWKSRSPHWYEAGGVLPTGYPALANGGTVKRKPGGVLMRVGEGRHDEKVQVLPLKGGEDTTKVEHHFHDSQFVFPNITQADEAEKFIQNLTDLAGAK